MSPRIPRAGPNTSATTPMSRTMAMPPASHRSAGDIDSVLTTGRPTRAGCPYAVASVTAHSMGGSAAAEDGRALLDEGLRRLTVVLGHPRVGVMRDLEVEALAELAVDGSVEVLLHVAVRHSRPLCETSGDRNRFVEQRVHREHAVDDAEVDGLLRIDPLRQEVELLGLGAP